MWGRRWRGDRFGKGGRVYGKGVGGRVCDVGVFGDVKRNCGLRLGMEVAMEMEMVGEREVIGNVFFLILKIIEIRFR